MPADPRTETSVDTVSVSNQAPAAGLVVIFSEKPDVRGAFPVSGYCSIGREARVDIRLDEPKVSRVHAEIEPAEDGVLVTDKDSHNGTSIDGARVRLGRQLAAFGSTLRVGNTLLHVVRDFRAYEDRRVDPDFAIKGGLWVDALSLVIDRLAREAWPVLIRGETGTGKELVARELHGRSGRAGNLVAKNCAAIPRELAESELFGHREGAFSGSKGHRIGLFRSADRGTLFLDEIGELDLDCQTKLLRVIEDREVCPVGGDAHVRVDTRLVAATHRDLAAMVSEGRFRADLMYRLDQARIELPALRERRADVPLLAEHFLPAGSVRCSAGAMERLVRHDWPGNVRELRNVVRKAAERALAAKRSSIAVEDLALPDADPDREIRERIIGALTRHHGNVTEAARELGWHRSTVYEELARLGIDAAKFRKK